MGLAIVHAREVACWPWDLRFCGEQPARAAICRTCQADVALPEARVKERPICIYCARASGLLEPVDVPFGEPS
jgi:hypothetical protein